MKRTLIIAWLAVLNAVLVGWLVAGLQQRKNLPRPASPDAGMESAPLSTSSDDRSAAQPTRAGRRVVPSDTPSTPFTAVYSPDQNRFAANLRGIRCPEETVKDIIAAEVDLRYQAQEQALRPKPADHVPWGWSSRTSEGRLLDRRQQASSLALEKEALLRESLGCEAAVPLPIYALTVSDQRFEDSLAPVSLDKRCVARQVQESYWTKVQALQGRTRGFWQSDDAGELERLKSERQQALQTILNGP
jgi:hypothetical protein